MLKDTGAATGQAGIQTHIADNTRTSIHNRPLGHDTHCPFFSFISIVWGNYDIL